MVDDKAATDEPVQFTRQHVLRVMDAIINVEGSELLKAFKGIDGPQNDFAVVGGFNSGRGGIDLFPWDDKETDQLVTATIALLRAFDSDNKKIEATYQYNGKVFISGAIADLEALQAFCSSKRRDLPATLAAQSQKRGA